MNAVKPRAPFQVLVMSEGSRLGRDAIETAYALKQLVQAGVRVFFYLEDRERTLDSPTDKIMLSLTAFADELEREKARQRTYNAMIRKARAGHVTGGRVFGYDKPSSVHEILRRPLYRGEIVWNRTKKRDRWGQHHQAPRPDDQWLRLDAPDLRIIPEPLWEAVQSRLKGIRERLLTAGGGRVGLRARDIGSHYLIPAFGRCGICGGGMCAMSRSHGKQRVFFYGCMAHHKRGNAVRINSTVVRMDCVDGAVLGAIGGDVLRPEIIDAVLDGVFAALSPNTTERPQQAQEALAAAEREIAHLTNAIASGGRLESLLAALKERHARHDQIVARMSAAAALRPAVDRAVVERNVRRKLAEWRSLLVRHVQDGRRLFREILPTPIRFWPVEGQRAFRFSGSADLSGMFSGVAGIVAVVLATCVASQAPPSWNQIVAFLRDMEGMRASGLPAA